MFLFLPFLDAGRTLALEHVVLQKAVFPLCQGTAEELDSVVGGGDLFAGPELHAVEYHARLVLCFVFVFAIT